MTGLSLFELLNMLIYGMYLTRCGHSYWFARMVRSEDCGLVPGVALLRRVQHRFSYPSRGGSYIPMDRRRRATTYFVPYRRISTPKTMFVLCIA